MSGWYSIAEVVFYLLGGKGMIKNVKIGEKEGRWYWLVDVCCLEFDDCAMEIRYWYCQVCWLRQGCGFFVHSGLSEMQPQYSCTCIIHSEVFHLRLAVTTELHHHHHQRKETLSIDHARPHLSKRRHQLPHSSSSPFRRQRLNMAISIVIPGPKLHAITSSLPSPIFRS